MSLFQRSALFCLYILPVALLAHLGFDGARVIRSVLTELFLVNMFNNRGSGIFQGCCLWFAMRPRFLGFIPSSRAIWT